jgi:hypothetical protein
MMSSDILVGAAKTARDALDYWTVGATIAGVIVLILYTAVTFWQARLTSAALEQTRRSNKATEDSNEIARRALELGKRAWLVVNLKPTSVHENIEITNLGGVPATNVETWYRFDLWESEEIPDSIAPKDGQLPRTGIIIGAGSSYTIVPKWGSWRTLFDKDTTRVTEGKAVYTFYCETKYLDVFNVPRITVACLQYYPKATVQEWVEWIYAPKHNRLE